MSVSRQLANEFEYAVRERGVSYHRRGRVQILRGADVAVRAEVLGSQTYQVDLLFEDGTLLVHCDCVYFHEQGLCKHLWATILAAEARGNLRQAGPIRRVARGCEAEGDLVDLEAGGEFLQPIAAPAGKPPVWLEQVAMIGEAARGVTGPGDPWPERRSILYVINVAATISTGVLILELMTRTLGRNGQWGKLRQLRMVRGQLNTLPESADREIFGLMTGASQHYGWVDTNLYGTIPVSYQLGQALAGLTMPRICATGRCHLRLAADSAEIVPVEWDTGGLWQFRLRLWREGASWMAGGVLRRGEESMDLKAPVLLTQGGLVFTRDRIAPLDPATNFAWISHLCKNGPIKAPVRDADNLLAALLEHPAAPPLEVPEELRWSEATLTPRSCLRISTPQGYQRQPGRLRAEVWFDYEGRSVLPAQRGRGFFQTESRRFVIRDLAAERAAAEQLRGLGLRTESYSVGEGPPAWQVPAGKLPAVARTLLAAGWHVEAEGRAFRKAGAFRVEVSSGVDWFELHGEAEYGDTTVKLPALLEALRRGENLVALGDGGYGLLPEEWLARFGGLAGLGTPGGDHIRFRRSQAGLLDALLAAQPEARCDETFARLRQQLREFEGVGAAEQPAGFSGQLRDYQCEGLGWMQFLERFGFGGCLADDMGVGKTAQVLALLETRRQRRAAGNGGTDAGPSLVVVPKSLVFNWKQEVARFTPALRVLDHTGPLRKVEGFDGYDLILTTYGTLRRDAALFQDFEFDYLVLDEAQAIKNAATESAKAARLLRGRQRLALSGTPVENHLGELWSLFEFLNPGMLGAASVFQLASGALRNPAEETRRLLAQALRPFILRRTKEQVARELPLKTEQTIYCEMEPLQRKLYNELRDHYRQALLGRIATQGLAKSKIQVLEALLRLRQVACHPGLLDPKRVAEPSAKLDLLMYRLREVLDEGHKALVFSQFTSLLRIVRQRLDQQDVTYEYLDGKTRDRQQRVERFQTDPQCPLFLISLKAGGLGLNLTAADYVFLLDPWWNPAVEAQAIDRTHRIGQTAQVFAYRLIARDTVEEKVLELQSTKRDLAAAIISADNSLIRDLKREDLELLLS